MVKRMNAADSIGRLPVRAASVHRPSIIRIVLMIAAVSGVSVFTAYFRGGDIRIMLIADVTASVIMMLITLISGADRRVLLFAVITVITGSMTQCCLAAHQGGSADAHMIHIIAASVMTAAAALMMLIKPFVSLMFSDKGFTVMLVMSVICYIAGLASGRINGASNWMEIGGMSLQISEAGKFLYIMMLANFCAHAGSGANGEGTGTLSGTKDRKILREMIRAGAPEAEKRLGRLLAAYMIHAVLLVLISEGGFLIIITVMTVYAIRISGANVTKTICGISRKDFVRAAAALGIAALAAVVILAVPQLRVSIADPVTEKLTARVNAMLHPEEYAYLEGWQALAVNKAVWNGWLFGSSVIEELPAAGNDMVFASICNMFGIVFGVIAVMLPALFGRVVSAAAVESGSAPCAVIGISLTVQAFINILGVIGVGMIVGVNLPFISSGGTSMMISMVSFGLIQTLQSERVRQYISDRVRQDVREAAEHVSKRYQSAPRVKMDDDHLRGYGGSAYCEVGSSPDLGGGKGGEGRVYL